jgi:hypothetical protein
VAFDSVDRDDTAHTGDRLDQLLRGFQTRNGSRSDPNYVLEPVDFSTSIPERFVKILRGSSLDPREKHTLAEEEVVETAEPETNSGLILLAENYNRNSQKSLARGRIFDVVALVVLFISSLVFSALAGFIWLGLATTLLAAVFVVFSRTSTSRGQEIKQIAEALIQPEEKP